jgi:diacylglycerol kinase family enzyme
MRATVIHNPSAGDGKLGTDDLLALVRQAGITPAYCEAKDPQLPEMLRRPAELLVVAGGDGTVAKVLARLPDRSMPVTILPAGTANNVARTFAIDGSFPDLIAGWSGAVRRRLAIGSARAAWGARRFVEAAGVGALAAGMKAAAELDAPAGERAQRARDALRRALAAARPLGTVVTVDGEALPGKLLLVEIMNIPYAGSGLELAPGADAGDGLLDVVTLEEGGRDAMLAWLGEPQPSGPPPVQTRRGAGIAFDWTGEPLHLDDEFPEAPQRPGRVELTLEPERVTILVPAARANAGVAGWRSA